MLGNLSYFFNMHITQTTVSPSINESSVAFASSLYLCPLRNEILESCEDASLSPYRMYLFVLHNTPWE